MRAMINVMVPMRDGVRLATNVFLPDGPGAFPALISRSPYGISGQFDAANHVTKRGYARVEQDCRGRFNSEGRFTAIQDETDDGPDLVAWVAEQPWCNGRIGLIGGSYHGLVQVPEAAAGHPAIQCMVPGMVAVNGFRDWVRYDGCFAGVLTINWAMNAGACHASPQMSQIRWPELHKAPDLETLFARAGYESPVLRGWVEHDRYDAFWERVDQFRMHSKVRVPGLHLGGWFDQFVKGTVWGYQGIRDNGATPAARRGQKMLMGPWGHGYAGSLTSPNWQYGELCLGPEAALSVADAEAQCVDHYLMDADNGYPDLPAVRAFLVGENRWIGLDDWPPPGSKEQVWYLDSPGRTAAGRGSGSLVRKKPSKSAEDRFRYDPSDPAPTWGGSLWGPESEKRGPVDQRPLFGRPDILRYYSDRLSKPLTVLGPIALDLHVSSSAKDTDIVAKFCAEYPDGRVMSLTLGSLRLRYRKSWSEPKPLTPGAPERISVDLGHTAWTLPAGSRLCLLVTSSDFPHIIPHANTMAGPFGEKKPVVAENAVLHGPGTFSCLRVTTVDEAP